MPVLIDQTGSIENDWIFLDDDQVLPPSGNCVVSVNRWFESRKALRRQNDCIGVLLEPDTDVLDLQHNLDDLSLIAIPFSVFSDGRGFSQARLLRERLGYQKNIRAIGNVLRDQLSFMARCGINQFALENEEDIVAALTAFSDFSVGYQTDFAQRAAG